MNRRDFISGVAAGAVASQLPAVAVPAMPDYSEYRTTGIGPTVTQMCDMTTMCWMVSIHDGTHVISDSCTKKEMVIHGQERAMATALARCKRIWNANSHNKIR